LSYKKLYKIKFFELFAYCNLGYNQIAVYNVIVLFNFVVVVKDTNHGETQF